MSPNGKSLGLMRTARARRFGAAMIAVLFCCIVNCTVVAEESAGQFRAGAIALDITPTRFPVDSAGSMTPRTAELAHDPLHARCLVLDNGQDRIAIVVCDSCMIPRTIFDAAKQRASGTAGIRVDHMLTAATHTHTAVTVTETFQSRVEVEYCDYLTERIAESIVAAASRLEPARIGWAVGNNPRQVFNRRWYLRRGETWTNPFGADSDAVKTNPPRGSSKLVTPAGPIDPQIPLLAVQSLDGRPIAVLANYALHYVGGVPNRALSADYFGQFAPQFTSLINAGEVDPPFVAIMSNGTSGDINNIDFYAPRDTRQPFEQIRLVAADVAESAHAAYQRVEYHDWVPLAMRHTQLELATRRPSAEEVADARRVLSQAGPPPYTELRPIYALETVQLADYPASVQVLLQAIRIGDLGIVSSPCETFVETGLAIKRQSPLRPAFVIELANGYNGYLPTPEQHALGGYETWRAKSSYLAADSEPAIRAALLRLLAEVARD